MNKSYDAILTSRRLESVSQSHGCQRPRFVEASEDDDFSVARVHDVEVLLDQRPMQRSSLVAAAGVKVAIDVRAALFGLHTNRSDLPIQVIEARAHCRTIARH